MLLSEILPVLQTGLRVVCWADEYRLRSLVIKYHKSTFFFFTQIVTLYNRKDFKILLHHINLRNDPQKKRATIGIVFCYIDFLQG